MLLASGRCLTSAWSWRARPSKVALHVCANLRRCIERTGGSPADIAPAAQARSVRRLGANAFTPPDSHTRARSRLRSWLDVPRKSPTHVDKHYGKDAGRVGYVLPKAAR